MATETRGLSSGVKKGIGAAVAVILVVLMVFSTKFVSPDEAAALNPAAFNPQTYAAQKFPEVATAIKEKATDIAVLAPAVDADPAAAGKQYGVDLGSSKFAFPVKAVGTASEVTADFIVLTVPGVSAPDVIRIPLGAAVSGTPVRDCTGTIGFGDFPDQTAFQSVANQFKLKMQSDVLAPLDKTALQGKNLTVYGAWATGGPANSFIIQPVSIEVAA